MTDQVPEQTTQIQLQLTDLVIAAKAIALASQRGAFRVEEFTQIGSSYDRIAQFLQDSGALTPPSSDTPADTTPAAI